MPWWYKPTYTPRCVAVQELGIAAIFEGHGCSHAFYRTLALTRFGRGFA